jgi:hypothetical protein
MVHYAAESESERTSAVRRPALIRCRGRPVCTICADEQFDAGEVGVGKLSWAANLERFGISLCVSAVIYVREAAVVSGNDVNREITKLYRAAVRPKRKYDLVHGLAKGLSAEAKVFLKKRQVPPSLGWSIPDDADILLDPATQDEACDGIVRLIQTGGKWKRGRKRPKKGRKRQSGVRSWTFEPLLYAPPLRTHPPKRNLELNFVMNLRLAYLEATGMQPPLQRDRELDDMDDDIPF